MALQQPAIHLVLRLGRVDRAEQPTGMPSRVLTFREGDEHLLTDRVIVDRPARAAAAREHLLSGARISIGGHAVAVASTKPIACGRPAPSIARDPARAAGCSRVGRNPVPRYRQRPAADARPRAPQQGTTRASSSAQRENPGRRTASRHPCRGGEVLRAAYALSSLARKSRLSRVKLVW